MSDIAINIENLSKRYRIGLREEFHDTFAGKLASWIRSPLHKLRRLRRMTTFIENGQSDHLDVIWALKDVSFHVKQEEVVGIIGRNGAGKSTLLKILSRITHPTSGRVVLNGRVSSLLEVGTGFHPELTGRENIYLNGTILGMTRLEIHKRLDEIVDFSGVGKFIDTPVKRYSSGMSVRLAFAVAAHLDPEILLVDEVLAVGDAEFQKKCLRKMGEVATEGRAVLFVSHNMAAVRSLCDRGILLNNGQAILSGNTEEVVRTYLESGSSGIGERLWPELQSAPGDETVRLHAVRIVNQFGEVVTQLDISSPIIVEIEYYVVTPGVPLNVSISVFNSEEVYVLASPSNTDIVWYGRPHPRGLFRSRCIIPELLLNQGRYSITVLLVNTERTQILAQVDRVISIEVVDLGKYRKGYFGYWGGVVRPLLNWETVFLPNDTHSAYTTD